MKHTDFQIASDLTLWNEYVAPGAEMDDAAFESLTIQERVFIVRECFGAEQVLARVAIVVDDAVTAIAEIDLNSLAWQGTPNLSDSVCVNALVYERIADALADGEMEGVVHTGDQTFGWEVE